MTALLIVKVVGLLVGALASIKAARKVPSAAGDRRGAIFLVVLGFGVAVAAELVDASLKQNNAIESTRRNNALLAEVQRTLHPLFPLSVGVAFRAPLTDDETRAFRTALEQKYQHDPPPDKQIVWLHPEDSEFPRCKKDPIALQIVSADLGSIVRLYSRQRTKDGRFEQPDVEFSLHPEMQKGRVYVVDDLRQRKVANREYVFRPDQGLYMGDGEQKIDFIDSKNTTEMVSVDDLLGATLEIATQPIDPSDDFCNPVISEQMEWITFASVAITLPGWRRLVIDRQRFTPVGPSKDTGDWLRYKFIIPEDKNEFEKLIRDEPFWVAAGRR